MIRDDEKGAAIEVEVWVLTYEAFGDFVAAIPGPLGIGKVLLEDGRTILCVYPKGHGRGGIVYKRSTDGGLTWSAPKRVNDVRPGWQWFASMSTATSAPMAFLPTIRS